ncbi:hypothetical protein [Paludisphaera soli]|uniref:hypothetical protein n=1 Tax=Paludisphaera soli TaxID=2712865 RepID=UPI0013EA23B3|nr:hypothetical protein [Paludisphaera soli]
MSTTNAEAIDAARVAALLEHEGLGYAHAARLLGCSVASVCRLVASLPPDRRPRENRGRRPAVDVGAVAALRMAGLAVGEIADELGSPPEAVRAALARVRRDELFRAPPTRAFIPSDPTCGVPFAPGLACDATGYDWQPRFRDVRPLPRSNPRKPAPPRHAWSADDRAAADRLVEAGKTLTRRERRALKFAEAEAERARELFGRLSGSTDPEQLEREGEALAKLHEGSRPADRAWPGLSVMACTVASPHAHRPERKPRTPWTRRAKRSGRRSRRPWRRSGCGASSGPPWRP